MKHSLTKIRIEIESLREETNRRRLVLELAICDQKQAWAIPFLREDLKVSEDLLAFLSQREADQAA